MTLTLVVVAADASRFSAERVGLLRNGAIRNGIDEVLGVVGHVAQFAGRFTFGKSITLGRSVDVALVLMAHFDLCRMR